MSLFDEILPKLKPYVLGWIQDLQQASTVGAHELSGVLHTGQLGDSQAPQFLKLDGSRTLIGNLPVADGITIDGVDISAHVGNANAHHNQVHALAGGDHTAAGLSVGQVIRASGASSFAWAQLGHADLGGVTGDQHHNQVHVITGADHTVSGNQYDVVGLSATNTLGVLASSDNPGANVRLLRSTSAGGLQLNLIDVAELQTDEVGSHLIPKLTDTYDLGTSTKLWRKGWLSELEAVLFVENTIQLLGGWFWVPKDAGTLPSDITAVQTTVDFGKAMTVGNFVIFRASLAVEYMTIGSLVSGTTYNVTRNVDGSGGNVWVAGQPFAVLGASGDGRIELNAYHTPRIQLIQQGATYNAQTELIRIGDLNGGWGYAAEKWGIAIGAYASTKPNITIDEDGVLRFRIYTTDVMTFSGGNADITGKLRMPGTSSAIAIGATPPTGAAAGTGIWIDRTGLFSLSAGTYQVKIDATNGKLYTGSGYGILDADGITLQYVSGWETAARIKFADFVTSRSIGTIHASGGGQNFIGMFASPATGLASTTQVSAEAPATHNAMAVLRTEQTGGLRQNNIYLISTPSVGYIALDANDYIDAQNEFRFTDLAGGAGIAKFYNGATLVGEITSSDTSYLRINPTTAKPIYAGQMVIAPAFVSGVTTSPGSNSIGYTGDLRPYRNGAFTSAYGFVPLTTELTSTSWDGDPRSTTAKTLIDLSAVFGAPAGIQAVYVTVVVRDSGSAAGNPYMLLSPNNTAGSGQAFSCQGQANDAWMYYNATIPCNANGDIYYQIAASGASTFDAFIVIWGYWI